jgi:lipopolysaccharide biosynthesis glycosyltransferase
MERACLPITLVISTDAEGLRRNSTLIASIVRRTKRSVKVRCYTRGFSQQSFEVRNLRVDFVRADEEVTGRFPGHVPVAVFDRLRIMKDEPEWERCLVLDHDMVCLSDLGEYFDEDFDGNLLLGRLFGDGNTLGLQMRGRGGLPESLAHAEDYPYFFMGPMLNLAAMREENTWETFLAVHEVLQQEEQLALTAAAGGRTKGVDRKWNQVPQWDNKKDEEGNEVCGITLEGIIHWTGGGKPWHINSKVWRPEIWEAERTNWEVLRAGEWDKPVIWELSGSPASELQHWFKRGWKLAVIREESPVPALAEGTELSEEAMLAREKEWRDKDTKAWDRLLDHPDVTLWEESEKVAAMGNPEVLVLRDVEQLRELLRSHPESASVPYVVLRRNNTPENAEALAALGYDRQWCRPKESAGALAEGVDYLDGPWSGEMPEECELLGWRAEPVKVRGKGRKPHEAVAVSG